jgi:hypothetical protein
MHMNDITTCHSPDDGLSDEDIQSCRDSLGWSIWAIEQATAITTFSIDDLVSEMTCDPKYAGEIVEVYRMMAFERAESANRERIADDIYNRLHNALSQANYLPEGDPLKQRIDYTKVSHTYGMDAYDIYSFRPDLR